MTHEPTSITVHINAYHTIRPVAGIVAALGHGELELSVGDEHSDGSRCQSTVWTREIVGETSRQPLVEAASWLGASRMAVEQLCSDGWELHVDVTMVARDPISSLAVPPVLMQEVNRHECLSLEFSVFPSPNLMP